MRIVDDIEQKIQQSEFLAILILAMKSIGESRMTDHRSSIILTISAGVTTNGLTGKCLTFPVTR